MSVRSSTSAIHAAALATLLAACASAPPAAPPVDQDSGEGVIDVIATLRLVNPRLACGVPGLRFTHGDEVLAVLGPDDRAEIALPIGRYVIQVHDGRGAIDHTVDVGPEGATLAPGCLPGPYGGPFGGPQLFPLTLVGPDEACGPPSVRARAGGLLVELAAGERQVLYLPRATHVVRILEDGKKGRDAVVELGESGAELRLVTCGATTTGPAPDTASVDR
ncbi:MAG: hypothetical protein IT385_29935 [Deltaproteobacteria bacterium]|nr:hypothetical protein [Deltaproteobacteria bacterium]